RIFCCRCDRCAERWRDFADPFCSDGISVELSALRQQKPKLADLQNLRRAVAGDFPMIINEVRLVERGEQFLRQRLRTRNVWKITAEKKIAGFFMERF